MSIRKHANPIRDRPNKNTTANPGCPLNPANAIMAAHAVAALKHTDVCGTFSRRTARAMRVRVCFADVVREGFFGISLPFKGKSTSRLSSIRAQRSQRTICQLTSLMLNVLAN
jgi:hypothetical protein